MTFSEPQPAWGPGRKDVSFHCKKKGYPIPSGNSPDMGCINPPKLEVQCWVYHIIYIIFDRCLSAVVCLSFSVDNIFIYFRGRPRQSFIIIHLFQRSGTSPMDSFIQEYPKWEVDLPFLEVKHLKLSSTMFTHMFFGIFGILAQAPPK